jgi:hypothetical protein
MKIFISWSGKPSKYIALAIREFIDSVFTQNINTFLSTEDIKLGQEGYGTIQTALAECDKGIFCFMKNNINSVWMTYEAGAISMQSSCAKKTTDVNNCPILPIMFEKIDDAKFSRHPLQYIQRQSFSRETMYHLVVELNTKGKFSFSSKVLEKQFNFAWPELENCVKNALYDHSERGDAVVNKEFLIDELQRREFPDPIVGEITKFVVLSYEKGFERQELYDALLSNVNRRMLLFGRKNSKVFANDNRRFFEKLKDKLEKKFEFKCLFLDPSAPNVENAQNNPDFVADLKLCIKKAFRMLNDCGIDPASVCKAYACERMDEIIVADDVALYSHIRFDSNGIPYPLTNAPFEVAELDNQIGANYKKHFDDAWRIARPIDEAFINSLG